MKKKIAIIIPAYKNIYLLKTLNSIYSMHRINEANVYVFDDNSPNNLYDICKDFERFDNFKYFKYNNNLGESDLARHWNRCISYTNEEWIWLFSDDDLVDTSCLNYFLTIDKCIDRYDVYRFNTKIVNQYDNVISENPKHPLVESSFDYILSKLKLERIGFVIEFIFNRRIFEENRGFISFPKAWNSDDSSWLIFGQEKGIYTIQNSFVYWRLSNFNISSIKEKDKQILLESSRNYISWLINNGYMKNIQKKSILQSWFIHQYFYINGYTLRSILYLFSEYKSFWNENYFLYLFSLIKYLFLKLKKKYACNLSI